MKSIVMPMHEQFPKENELFNEVKETVANNIPINNGIKSQKKKGFTVQEMWNRQRTAKSASAMMRRWNLN